MASNAQFKMFIDGRWRDGSSRPVINPATEATIGTVALASEEDLDLALAAAEHGFRTWRSTPAVGRSRILRRIADLLRERTAEIAETLTAEEGKTIAEARDEVEKAAEHFEWMSEECRRAYGRVIPPRSLDMRQLATVEPIGPVAAFTPWNFPATGPARKISTALAAGCSIIIKAAEETPGTCVAIVKACEDAGVPRGVVNLVFGVPSQVSQRLIDSPIIRKVTFTGSVPVGIRLAELAARTLKPCTMELGGQAPFIVFEDADSTMAAKAAFTGKFRNAGQVCVAPTRFFIHESKYDSFLSEFGELARKLRVGNGADPNSQMGCVQNPRRMSAMEDFTSDAIRQGGRVALGGERIGNRGYFWQPTIVADVPDSAAVMTKEPFGPIAAVVAFKEFDEVVDRANSVAYGLASYVFTGSAKIARHISQALDVGMVAVNGLAVSPPEAPMGGVKDSGYGREGGSEGLLEYMKCKYVSEVHA